MRPETKTQIYTCDRTCLHARNLPDADRCHAVSLLWCDKYKNAVYVGMTCSGKEKK